MADILTDPDEPLILDLNAALNEGRARYGHGPIKRVRNRLSDTADENARRLRTLLGSSKFQVFSTGIRHEDSNRVFTATCGWKRPYYYIDVAPSGYHGSLSGRKLHVVSGTCMFATGLVIGKSKAGTTFDLTEPSALLSIKEKIQSISVDERLHVYELETITRLGDFTRRLIQHTNHLSEIKFHLPRAEYALYGLELYSRGLISELAFPHYLMAINTRAKLLEPIIDHEFSPWVTIGSPLDFLDIDVLAESDPSTLVSEIFRTVRYKDPLWYHLMRLSPPKNLLDLNRLSYTYRYLASMQDASLTGGVMVAIENPDETPIYKHAIQFLKELSLTEQPHVALYIHPRVVTCETVHPGDARTLINLPNGWDRKVIQEAISPYLRQNNRLVYPF